MAEKVTTAKASAALWRRMSFMQRDLLGSLGDGPRTCVADHRTAVALAAKGLAEHDAGSDVWKITDKGRDVLVRRGLDSEE